MKKLILLLSVLLLVSCKKEEKKESLYPESAPTSQTPIELGQEIFEGKGKCFSCHQPEQKIVGPSIQEIANTYKAKKGNIVSFLKDEADPLVDPSQFEVMKTNFPVTKTFSEQELKAVEAYIYSHAK